MNPTTEGLQIIFLKGNQVSDYVLNVAAAQQPAQQETLQNLV
jgi:uncharacterized protein YcgI (DUF1989 family)